MADKPMNNPKWQKFLRPMVCCCLGLVLFVMAVVIILALIPAYLRIRENQNRSRFEETRTMQINYIMDPMISLANVDRSALARQLETVMNARSGFLSVHSVDGGTAVSGRRRRAIRCDAPELSGPVMRLLVIASNVPLDQIKRVSRFCIDEHCMQQMFDQIKEQFYRMRDFIINVSYQNPATASQSVRLRFCSMNATKLENTTSSGSGGYVSPKQRALVNVTTESIVGVLFDEIPIEAHEMAQSLLDAKGDDFWRHMATQQMQYTQVRLIFRPSFYEDVEAPSKRGTLSLTLPKFFRFTFNTKPAFITIDGHLLYARNYTFHNVLITDAESLAESDDRLANIGSAMTETFNLPVDPFLVLQRTGFACMSEDQWPPNSIDPETTEKFYDDTCEAEEPQDPTLKGCQQCHCSYPLPTVSCLDALKESIGHIQMDLVLTRIADNSTLADEWRHPKEGPSVNAKGEVAPVNLFEDHEALAEIRFVYRYIGADSCEIVEKCVTGSGWRRLLLFPTTVPNFGIEDLRLGSVSYFADTEPSEYVTKHRIYEYSPCHQHFHFAYYGSFSFGTEHTIQNTKRGFCLQTTYRHANTEWSVMAQDHYVCAQQGIAPGWSDTYQAGLPCQWIDVSTYNTSVTTHTDQLISRLNPYNFLCEGIADNRTWLATNFTTMCCGGSGCCGDTPMTNCCGGLPVSKQACQHWDEAEEDNLSKLTVTIPLDGEGQVTADCGSSTGHWGEKRDCGFRLHPKGKMLSCGTAGKNTTLHNLTSTKKLQVVRLCEASIMLNSCLACIWNDSLSTITIQESNMPIDIEFLCTSPRDTQEIGGKFCIYVAPFFEEHDHNPEAIQWTAIEQ